jgi:hypothetical protein
VSVQVLPFQSRFVTVAGHKMHYVDEGSGLLFSVSTVTLRGVIFIVTLFASFATRFELSLRIFLDADYQIERRGRNSRR